MPDRSTILCLGEALIDMVPRSSPEGLVFLPCPGGAVFNTAIAAGRLGADVRFLWGLSTDLFGDQLAAALAASSVDASLCPRPERPTTLAFVTLVDGQARYLFLDENTAGRMLTPADMPQIPDDVGALFLGGISLVAEPCGTAVESVVQRAAGRLIMLDPNIRPNFIRDEPAFRARIARLLRSAHVVKVSNEDLDWISGPGDMAPRARALLDSGPALVLVTLGSGGAQAFGRGWDVTMAAPQVTLADTVGAGDTFNAGILTALAEAGALSPAGVAALDRERTKGILDLAVRAAALSVARVGADPPWRNEL